MKPLFSEEGKKRLEEILKKGILCAFDFDGTLVPIASHPDEVHLPGDVYERLNTLSKLTPVAILTGRSIKDIQPRLRFSPAYLIGNHGLEGIPGWEEHSSHYHALAEKWNHAIQNALQKENTLDKNIRIENKRYSLAIHYRHTDNPEKTKKVLLPLIQKVAPDARIIAGKYLYSLVPADAPDKGKALNELMRISRAPSVIYAGDDTTDEDVFRLPRTDLMAIRVEKTGSSAAEWYIEKNEDITKILDHLIDRLQSHKKPAKPSD